LHTSEEPAATFTWHEVTTMGDLLDRRRVHYRDRDAIVLPGERVTYEELGSRADSVALGLLALGVQQGDRVGFLLPDQVESIAVMFGAMKVGAIPVPVNARFKEVELKQVITHSGMTVLITSPDFSAVLRRVLPHVAQLHVVELGADSERLFRAAADQVTASALHERQLLVRVRDTAIIIYTSGTTAAPKGAMLSHEALCRVADGMVHARFKMTPEDRVWTALPLFHIGGIAFAVATLYAGASYCHVGAFEPAAALRHLVGQRCTIALAGFETIWMPIVNLGEFAEADLSELRAVMAVGVPERLKDMQARTPQATLVSTFGQTEACSFLSLNHLDDPEEKRVTTGGVPLPGMRVRVVDPETGVDLPPGTPGELLYQGTNCFDGYFRDPELTATVIDQDGWFHTGDMATLDSDGRVMFVSRLKDMLKVGGENVAAAEVEGYLLTHPAVAFAQVVAAPDARYVEVPAAFIMLKPGTAPTEAEIIDFCRGKIATYRVPRYIRFVTEWPMSGTKIKKYVLREQIATELAAKGITEAPKIYSTRVVR
jgi:fatty-acyl-CoA synthase